MIWIVGAVCIDLVAVRDKFLEGTSNPADIRMGLGGVGYRVFSNLDAPKRFITALASDPISRFAESALASEGDVAIQRVKDAGPPLYLALMEGGSLKIAASDLRIVEQSLELPFVLGQIVNPVADDFLVLDANLSPSLVGELLRRFAGRIRIVFEPVSVEKAQRHSEVLSDLFLLTPTEEEMAALMGDRDDIDRAGELHEYAEARRIANIVVTRGKQGASLYARRAREDFLPTAVVVTRDSTGAGDLLLSFMLGWLARGLDMPRAIRRAMDAVEGWLGEGSS
jgi:sugar/nucleoside kinase (ribokinase family)